MTRGQCALLQHLLDRLGQGEKTQHIGDMAAALADSLRQSILGMGKLVHQAPVALRLLERRQVLALDILDERDFQGGAIVATAWILAYIAGGEARHATVESHTELLLAEFAPEVERATQHDLAARGLLPGWLGDGRVHLSHRSALVRKDPEFYRPAFGDVPDDVPYHWPDADPLPPPPPPAGRPLGVVRAPTDAAAGAFLTDCYAAVARAGRRSAEGSKSRSPAVHGSRATTAVHSSGSPRSSSTTSGRSRDTRPTASRPDPASPTTSRSSSSESTDTRP